MPDIVTVKFKYSGTDLWFDQSGIEVSAGDHVIVSTERGTEIGLVVRDPFVAPEEELPGSPLKPVLRVATDHDLSLAEELSIKGESAAPVFRQYIEKHKLDMKPVGVEFLFGGEKAVFYFAAVERVDFRELVRDLASHFQQRIDMRQIGVRDEARIVGGMAMCGEELCCTRYMTDFEPVSIRMAKEQDLPLNPSKISGVCGRLMCCLRYEFEAYKDFKSRAPKYGAVIETPLGTAKVAGYNTPREIITLRLEDGKSFDVPLGKMECDKDSNSKRPCRVSRDSLETLDNIALAMALSQMDREQEFQELKDTDNLDLQDNESSKQRSSRKEKQSKDDNQSDQKRKPSERQERRPRRRSSQNQNEKQSNQKERDDRNKSDKQSEKPGLSSTRRQRNSKASDSQATPRKRRQHTSSSTRDKKTAAQRASSAPRRRRRSGDRGGNS